MDMLAALVALVVVHIQQEEVVVPVVEEVLVVHLLAVLLVLAVLAYQMFMHMDHQIQ